MKLFFIIGAKTFIMLYVNNPIMLAFLFAIAASGLLGSDFSSVCFAIMYLSSQAMSVILQECIVWHIQHLAWGKVQMHFQKYV